MSPVSSIETKGRYPWGAAAAVGLSSLGEYPPEGWCSRKDGVGTGAAVWIGVTSTQQQDIGKEVTAPRRSSSRTFFGGEVYPLPK